jgi:hypothetical protein
MMCDCDIEEREHGVGAGVNDTMLSETLRVIRLAESAVRVFRLRKTNMNLCGYDCESRLGSSSFFLFVVYA